MRRSVNIALEGRKIEMSERVERLLKRIDEHFADLQLLEIKVPPLLAVTGKYKPTDQNNDQDNN